MKKIISILFSIMSIMLLIGCAEENQKEQQQESRQEVSAVTLTVWTPQEEQDRSHNWLFHLCDSFSQTHPEWDITWKLGVCDAQSVLKTFSADPAQAADVYLFTSEQLEELIDADFLAQFGGDTLLLIQANSPRAVLDTVKGSDGGVYGIPLSVNTELLYYDKSFFSESDIATLNQMANKNTVAVPIDRPWVLSSFYAADGGMDWIDTEEGYAFNEAEAIEATKSISALVNKPNIIKENGAKAIEEKNAKAAFARSDDAAKIQQILEDDFGVSVLPCIEIGGQQKPLKNFIQTTAVGVNPDCSYPQAAIEFASYLASEKAQLNRYHLLGYIPASVLAYSDQAVNADAILSVHKMALGENAMAQPSQKAAALFNKAEGWLADALKSGAVTEDNAAGITQKFMELAD